MIYVVRHGSTDWNDKKISMGSKDIPLNDKGKAEALNTASLLQNYDFDLIISSPLIRALETANIINKDRDNQIVIEDRLTERYLGELEGKPYPADNADNQKFS